MRGNTLARRAGLIMAVAAIGLAAPAPAEHRFSPYLEVQQVLDADLNRGGDVLTYTTLGAGVDGSVSNRRVTATINYRYERDIPWNKHRATGQSIHTGVARGELKLVPDTLSLDAGAIATRTRTDIRGAAPAFTSDNTNLTQVYGVYGGPTLSTHAGPIQIGANYTLGYVRAQAHTHLDLPAGEQRTGYFDSSLSHSLNASFGMPTGQLPVGWTVSGGYEREDQHQLDQRYTAKFVRGDLVFPVGPTLALTGGAGYEHIRSSERPPLLDAQGLPVVDGNGRLVTDHGSPRLLAYDSDGLIYDVGVIWRPNRRTKLEVRAGHRYGGTMVIGSLDWRMTQTSGLQIRVYDGIEDFGRLLTRNLSSLPNEFTLPTNPLINNVPGCIFGTTPGTGGCLNDGLQSLNGANFRNRGVNVLYSLGAGRWTFGIGGTYVERKYLTPVIGTSSFFSIDRVKDESWSLEGTASRQLGRRSTLNAAVFADWYKSGIADTNDVSTVAGTVSYNYLFTRHLSAQAAVGVYDYDEHGVRNRVSGQLLFGARYQF